MKYKTKHFVITALVGVLFSASSCRQNNDTSQNPPAIEIQAHIGNKSKTISRTTDFQKDDNMGVYIVPCATSGTTPVSNSLLPIGNYRDNLKFIHNGTSGFVINDNKNANYPNTITKVDLYAITPWLDLSDDDGSLNDVKEYLFKINADQSTPQKIVASDIMTAKVLAKAPNTTPAGFTFDHRLAKTYITVKKPSTYKTLTVSAIKSVTINGTYTTAKIDLTDNTKTPQADKTSGVIEQITPCYDQTSTDPDYSYEAIIVPQQVDKLQIDITITANNQDYTFNYTAPAAFTFQAGNNHNMTFTLEDEKVILIGAPAITAWATNTVETALTLPEMAANESFKLAGIGTISGLVSAKITCADTKTYTITATQDMSDVTFKFNGQFNKAPERYPYTITKVELLNGSGTVIGSAYNILTAKGLVSARTSTEIQLN